MRSNWRLWLLIALLVVGVGYVLFRGGLPVTPPANPTATNTAVVPTRTPRVPTATPVIIETEVFDGIRFTAVTITQENIPTGEAVELPLVEADGTAIYTYDGNLLTITANIESASPLTFPLRVTVEDVTTGEVITSLDLPVPSGLQETAILTWDTFDSAWRADGTPVGARDIVVKLLDEAGEALDSAAFNLTVRPRPVILVHGWNSTEGMWSNYVGYLSSVADGWLALPADNLSTGGGGRPFHDAKWNADKLAEYIDGQRAALEAAHVDVVGHSMGGLIGRAYLQAHGGRDSDGQPVVTRLITLGTPNTGSPCGNIGAVLNVFSKSLDGAWHFTPAYMREFNATVSETHGTLIHALAGTSVWTCGAQGDGVVPVSSATAYGVDNHIAQFTAHIPGVEIWEVLFGARDFEYSEAQFTAYVLGQLRVPWADAPAVVFNAQAAPASPEDSDAPPVTQRYTLTIPAGSLAIVTVNAFDGEDLGVLIAPVPGLSAELRKPDGSVIAALSAEEMASMPLAILPYTDAPAGTYSVHFANSSSEQATVELAVFESGLSYVLEIDIIPQDDGKTLIRAELMRDGVPVTNAVLTAHLDVVTNDDDSVPAVHPLTDEAAGDLSVNDGVYSALLDLPAGVYALAVKAQTANYSVTESHTFIVAEPTSD